MGLQTVAASLSHGITIDAIILDYHMPDMNGAEVARRLRDTPEFSSIPVVMLTSMDMNTEDGSMENLQVDFHLMKPARGSLLLDTLINAIQGGRQKKLTPTVASQPEAAVQPPAVLAEISATSGNQMSQPNTEQEIAAKPVQPKPVRSQTRVATTVVQPPHLSTDVPSFIPSPATSQSGVHVLVVEDNDVNQLLITKVLSRIDCTYEVASNGKLGVEAFKERRPNLVLMDVSMPVMNGYDATFAIREFENTVGGHVPIIGCTAHALTGDKEKCLDCGMDDYLPKPFGPQRIEERIRFWTEKTQATA